LHHFIKKIRQRCQATLLYGLDHELIIATKYIDTRHIADAEEYQREKDEEK